MWIEDKVFIEGRVARGKVNSVCRSYVHVAYRLMMSWMWISRTCCSSHNDSFNEIAWNEKVNEWDYGCQIMFGRHTHAWKFNKFSLFYLLCLNFRLVLLIWIETSNHVAHTLCEQVRWWHCWKNHVAPIVSRPVISVWTAISVLKVTAMAAMLYGLWRLFDGVIELVIIGKATEE